MKILSIDDSRSIHAFLKNCFSETSHELHHAMSGEEGLDRVKGEATPFDLILLDWEMPGLQGPDVLKSIKDSGVSSPVVMLTSKNANEDILKVLSLGALEYVIKPFTQELLFEKLEAALGVEMGARRVS